MLNSILYWIKASNLVEPEDPKTKIRPPLKLTILGKLIEKYDPYLEDIASLWCIHWELSTNKNMATFWYWAFNELNLVEFSPSRLIELIEKYISEAQNKKVASSSLIKDVNCFLRTYSTDDKFDGNIIEDNINCPLVSLGLVTQSGDTYRWRIGKHTNLPTEIFGYGLYKFKELIYKDSIEIKLDQLRFGKYSPGKIFGLSNVEIPNYIEKFNSIYPNALNIISTNNLNLLRIDNQLNSEMILENYFKTLTDPSKC